MVNIPRSQSISQIINVQSVAHVFPRDNGMYISLLVPLHLDAFPCVGCLEMSDTTGLSHVSCEHFPF